MSAGRVSAVQGFFHGFSNSSTAFCHQRPQLHKPTTQSIANTDHSCERAATAVSADLRSFSRFHCRCLRMIPRLYVVKLPAPSAPPCRGSVTESGLENHAFAVRINQAQFLWVDLRAATASSFLGRKNLKLGSREHKQIQGEVGVGASGASLVEASKFPNARCRLCTLTLKPDRVAPILRVMRGPAGTTRAMGTGADNGLRHVQKELAV